MNPLDRSVFEALLTQLGYAAAGPFAEGACEHPGGERWALYYMPDEETACDIHESSEAPRIYGDLGWQVYYGCEDCVMDNAHCVWHGDRFEHLRIFDGKAEQTPESIKVRALRPATDLLRDDEG